MDTKKEVFSQTIQLVNGAFAFIAALAWNEAVKTLIDRYISSGSGIYSKFVYAIFITVLAVFITSKLSRIKGKIDGAEAGTQMKQE